MLAHPSLLLLSGPFDRTDLFTVVYCLVDDWFKRRYGSPNAPRRRRGPRPEEFSDAELLTVLLVGELCQVRRERAWLRQVRASYRSLFPRLPEDSRFSRRAARARELLRGLREAILFWADADLEPLRLLDSFPMPLCACYRIRQSSLPIPPATFGYNPRKRLYYYGLRPALLMTASGFVVDLILAPGNCNDTPLLAAYLDECVEAGRDLRGQVWVADNGDQNAALIQWAQARLGLTLVVRQKDPKGEPTPAWQRTIDAVRKPIEGMIAVLTECLGIQHLLAKTEWGLYRRAQAKATALALARYFNRVLDRDPTDLARYAV